jgi:hypothetical protein
VATPEQADATQRTYSAIGRFIFQFSQVEYTIRYYLAEEIRLPEEHFASVVGSYDVGALIAVAKEVFRKSGEGYASIERLLNRFFTINGTRNQVAHGLWVPFKDGGTLHYVSRNRPVAVWSTDKAAELERLADELSDLNADLERAMRGF